MSWLDKLRETAASAGETTQRQARRAKLEVAANRIARRIRGRKMAIGQALYPDLKSGDLKVEHPDVGIAMTAIAAMENKLAANRAELESVMAYSSAEEAEPGDADER